ncbi:Structural maintenance of chromosomes protein 5 [Entophlyctis luteolus]|nr:Structural maintenance of chromosomes protein 5 [Entophlyctis luteolus]
MSPKELLVETERAVGDKSLLELHTALITKSKELKAMEQSFESDSAHLASLEKKQSELEILVKQYQEHLHHVNEAKLIRCAIPLVRYLNLRDAARSARAARDEIGAAKRTSDKQIEPVTRIVKLCRELVKSTRESARDAVLTSANIVGTVDEALKRVSANEEAEDAHAGSVEKSKRDMQEALARVSSTKGKLDKKQLEIEKIREDLFQSGLLGPDGSDLLDQSPEIAAINAQIEKVVIKGNQIAREIENFGNQKIPLYDDARSCDREIDHLNREITALTSVANQKLRALEQMNKDTATAVRILRENNHGLQFEKEIYEPICLGLTAVAPELAAALENTIGVSKLTSFVAQTERDYLLFRNYMYDTRRIRINIVCVQNLRNSFQSSIPKEELERLGFDGVLIDYVRGSPVLMSALVQYTGVDQTPIRIDERNFNFSKVDTQSNIKNYVCGQYSYSVRSSYGSTSTRSEQLHPARILKLSVDSDHEENLQRRVREWQNRKQEIDDELKSIDARAAHSKSLEGELRIKKIELVERKRELMNRRLKFEKSQAELETINVELENSEKELALSRKRLTQLIEQKKRFVHDRAELNLNLTKQQLKSVKLFDNVIKSSLSKVQADAELTDAQLVENLMKEKAAEINSAQSISLAKQAQDEVKKVDRILSDDEKEGVNRVRDGKSVEDLEVLLDQTMARAELLKPADVNIMSDFKNREQEIEQFKIRHQRNEKVTAKGREEIEKIRMDWEPALQELISRINDQFFDALKAKKEDDFAEWSVEIRVKFRDNERLQVLDKHRQSGGERSVTTIAYLMALQKMSKSPFRVVDEINQGMDPRNERAVHAQMVHVACQKGGSQYFLITPKLLPNLTYHENMKILTIYNGDHQPEKFDVEGFLKNKKRRLS